MWERSEGDRPGVEEGVGAGGSAATRGRVRITPRRQRSLFNSRAMMPYQRHQRRFYPQSVCETNLVNPTWAPMRFFVRFDLVGAFIICSAT